jgi:hypothetical protein
MATAPVAASAPASAASAAGELGAPSAAEKLLFVHPHLASIHEPRSLRYDYVAEAASAPRTTDHATLELRAGAGGRCCASHIDFLSGPNAIVLPDLDEPQGNPILLYFLESEVRLLERTTHGQAAHFRRRIRQALADAATVQDTTVRWSGKDVPAQVVRIAPFLTDPYRPRFEREATTEYAFVLSDAVPGGLVRLSATVPAAAASATPQAQRSLALADPQPQP